MKKFNKKVIGATINIMSAIGTAALLSYIPQGMAGDKVPDDIFNFAYNYEVGMFEHRRHYYGKNGPYKIVEYSDIERAFQKNAVKAASDFSNDFILTQVRIGGTYELEDGKGRLQAKSAGEFVIMPVNFIFTHASDLVGIEDDLNANYVLCTGGASAKFGGIFYDCSSFFGRFVREVATPAGDAYRKNANKDALKVLKGGKSMYIEGLVHYLAYKAVQEDQALKLECSTGIGPKCLDGIDRALGFEVGK